MDTTIKIKADTSQATSSLKSLQAAAREISQNLRLVKSDLNFDAGNIPAAPGGGPGLAERARAFALMSLIK